MKKNVTFTNSIDPDETPLYAQGSALFAMLSTFLVTVDNTKSYMNQDRFHFFNGCMLKPLKGVFQQN